MSNHSEPTWAAESISGPPTLPVIHLNGRSPEDLLRQQRNVLRAVEALREALAAASPNSRDYYVLTPEAFVTATKEHQAELALIAAIEERHAALCLAIMKGLPIAGSKGPAMEGPSSPYMKQSLA